MNEVLVSVMVPSRNRIDMLKQSLESLISTCDLTPHRQIEIIVKVDDDDKATEHFLLQNPHLVTTIVTGPRGNGYADLHLMYNRMCVLARGKFLFLWNDDATMLTPGWDLEIARHDDDKLCYLRAGVSDSRGRDQFLFPIVHRSYYDVLGHFSRSAHNDTYVFSAFKRWPQLFRNTDIIIQHHALETNDLTSTEAKEHWNETKTMWDSAEVQDGLREDIRRLEWLMKQQDEPGVL